MAAILPQHGGHFVSVCVCVWLCDNLTLRFRWDRSIGDAIAAGAATAPLPAPERPTRWRPSLDGRPSTACRPFSVCATVVARQQIAKKNRGQKENGTEAAEWNSRRCTTHTHKNHRKCGSFSDVISALRANCWRCCWR